MRRIILQKATVLVAVLCMGAAAQAQRGSFAVGTATAAPGQKATGFIEVPAGVDPAKVAGTVVILPLVNIQSFLQKVPHVNPVDGKSMNRFYPGKQDGTQTERASWLITKQVVERCDYLIDYHGGDL